MTVPMAWMNSSSPHGRKDSPYLSTKPSFQGMSHSTAVTDESMKEKQTGDAMNIGMTAEDICRTLAINIV